MPYTECKNIYPETNIWKKEKIPYEDRRDRNVIYNINDSPHRTMNSKYILIWVSWGTGENQKNGLTSIFGKYWVKI